MDDDGDFVVVWESAGSYSSDTSGYSIQGQRYNSNGNPQGSEFQINTFTTGDQHLPAVAMDGDGNFVVVWEDTRIRGQRYDSNGALQGSEFEVTSNPATFAKVSMDDEGDFVVVWQSSNDSDSDGFGVYARRYNNGTPQGSHFQVNTYTTGHQSFPRVALDSDGDFVVAWESTATQNDDTNWSIQARAFTKGGLPLWGEFQVNSYTTGNQRYPGLAIDSDGDFVLAWQSDGSPNTDTDGYSIQARRFDLGQSDYQVNTYTTGHQRNPAVALDSDGDFVIVWQSTSATGDGDGQSIHARRFNSNGLPLGDQFQVNTYTTGNQRNPDVAMDAAGNFIIVWQSEGSNTGSPVDTDQYSIQAQRYSSTGQAIGSQFQVNTHTIGRQRNPAVAMNSAGDFTVVWESDTSAGNDNLNSSIQQRRYNAVATPLDPADVQVNTYTTGAQRFPDIAAEANGDFVVAWASFGSAGSDTSHYSIQHRRFTAAGTPLDANDIQVNTYTIALQLLPAVAMDSDGDFVITWESIGDSGGDPDYSIQAQRYTNAGAAVGSQFRVNTYTTGDQRYPAVAMDSSGNFVVTWRSTGSPGPAGADTDGYSIHAQRYNSTGATQGNQFQVNTYTTNNQANPAVSLDSDGDFVITWESNGLTTPPFLAPLANDNTYAIAASRFTALAAPEPTALTLQSATTRPTPRSSLPAIFATFTTLLTLTYRRLRRH